MTHFEYLSVAFSIVLSLAVVRVLGGLAVAFAPGRRYTPHAAWLVFTLLSSAMVWWNFWSFLEVRWNIFSFVLVLGVPALVYFQAAALVPEGAASVESWRDHFFAARRRFFVALALLFVVTWGATWLLLGFPMLHPLRGIQALALSLAIAGAVSGDRRLHAALPGVFLAILMTAATFVFVRPGAMASPP